MAWNTRWQVQFKSLRGTTYTVNISEQGWTGGVTQLTPSDQPFTTQEDDDDDIFKPIRAQSGYLRVIDETGTLLEDIIPQSNTTRYVEVLKDNAVVWQGFLLAESYTQDWSPAKKEVEIPVQSILGVMKNVNFNLGYSGYRRNFAYLLYIAVQHVQAITGAWPYDNVVVIDNEETPGTFLTSMYVQWSQFFEKIEMHNAGDTVIEWQGNSLYDVMAEMAQLFGLTMRENGRTLYLVNYDSRSNNQMATYTWNQIGTMGGGTSQLPSTTALSDIALIDNISFRSDNNSQSVQEGANTVEVNFSFETDKLIDMTIPPATEDDSEVKTVTCHSAADMHTYDVLIQPHPNRYGMGETFGYQYYEYLGVNGGEGIYQWWGYRGASNYATVLDHSVMNSAYRDWSPTYQVGRMNYTGAFPCRYRNTDTESTGQLHSGLFLAANYRMSNNAGNVQVKIAYLQKMQTGTTIKDGYLRLSLSTILFNTFWHTAGSTSTQYLALNSTPGTESTPLNMTMHIVMHLQSGGLRYWNGSSWTSAAEAIRPQIIKGKIKNNYSDDYNVEKKDAFYIPVTSEMVGKLEIAIYDYVSYEDGYSFDSQLSYRNLIITDFELDFVQKNDSITYSDRTSNHYYTKVLLAGFDNNKEVNTKIGTFNNNMPSASFLTNSAGDYAETLTYNDGTQRPEINLLQRMANFYCTARWILSPVISEIVEQMFRRYTYKGRTFFGVVSQHNWRDNEQKMKFLEVKSSVTVSSSQQSMSLEFEEGEGDTSEAQGIDVTFEEEIENPNE